MKTVERDWKSYRGRYADREAWANEDQLRRAFFAGAITLMGRLLEASYSGHEQLEAVVQDVRKELGDHAEEMMNAGY